MAPGRLNVIGEHVDYNGGFVLPAAIEREIVLVARPRLDRVVRLCSGLSDEAVSFSLDDLSPAGPRGWEVYVKGVLAGLEAHGFRLCGFDAEIVSNLPVGGGLSSSAALEAVAGLITLAMTEDTCDRMQLAKICQQAEHRYAGVPCGIMDQAAVLTCQADHLLLLDCQTGQARHIPFQDSRWGLMIIHSGVSHALAEGEYAKRRKACEEAAALLKVSSLRDIPIADLDDALKHPGLNDEKRRCVRHVVSEIDRTLRAVECLACEDYRTLGKLLCESHASLRDDYRVSCPELDFIVKTASGLDGVAGCRMTGGGFGGAAVALVRSDAAEAVRDHLRSAFAAQFGAEPWMLMTRPAVGARAWRRC